MSFNLLILLLIPNITEALDINGTSETLTGTIALTNLQRAVFIRFCLGLLVIFLCYIYLCDWCPIASNMDDEYRSTYLIRHLLPFNAVN